MFDDLFSLNGPYARLMNWLWNILMVSVLWLLCCIPVITIGASCTAAYYASAKVVRHRTGTVISEFFSSFRMNLGQSIILTLLFGPVFFVLLLETFYIYSSPDFPVSLLYAFYFLTAFVLSCMNYLWACLSRFSQSTFSFVRMCILIAFRHLPTTILLFLIQGVGAIAVYLMPWGIILFPGICYYVSTFLMEKVLLRYSPKVCDTDPESNKWYYQ